MVSSILSIVNISLTPSPLGENALCTSTVPHASTIPPSIFIVSVNTVGHAFALIV
jgi:hypothetical protein